MRGVKLGTIGGAVVLGLLVHACGGGDGGGGTTQPQTGSIAGDILVGTSGVSGAQVALSGGGTGSAATNANGRYRFDNLAPAQYTVTLSVPSGFALADGQTAAKNAQVQAGQTAEVDWTLIEQNTGGTVQEIRASGVSFSPANVTIQTGTTVRWIIDDGSHTVTPDNANQSGAWTGTGLLNAGAQFEFTFTTAGTYNYHCEPHRSAGMTGVIVVQ